MNMPEFNAELSLYKTAGRYALQSAWIGRSGNHVSLQLAKGCGPCIDGTTVCCFGFDPETREPFCEERRCTPPPPPPPPPVAYYSCESTSKQCTCTGGGDCINMDRAKVCADNPTCGPISCTCKWKQ